MSLSRQELLRKVVHILVGGIAFAVRPLGAALSALAAVAAIVMNAFVLPRVGGRNLWRENEAARGYALGIVLYPTAVLLLILIYWQRLEVAAATWGILAFGDGMASIAGRAFGTAKLPWNPVKSWAGSIAYAFFGGAGATILLLWTAPGRYPLWFAIAAGATTALFSAALESLPHGLDDNLGVPLVSALLLFCILLSQGGWDVVLAPELRLRAGIGLAVNVALALAAYAARGVDLSGAIVGIVLGTTIWAFLGWRGFLLLFAFFVLGTVATKIGYAEKARARLAQGKGGRRGARNAIAKTSVPTLASIFAATTPYPQVFAAAAAGAFATAAMDTVSSEIGQVYGRRTFLITTLAPVPRGTEGAISLEGTVAGLLAALGVGALGAAAGLYPWPVTVAIVVAATIATTLESVLGATLEKRGLLDNESVNFLNTLAGALVAATIALALDSR